MNTLTDTEFGPFQRFICDAAGITLSTAKKALVSGRLAKHFGPLGELARSAGPRVQPFRAWSAASSTGEEMKPPRSLSFAAPGGVLVDGPASADPRQAMTDRSR